MEKEERVEARARARVEELLNWVSENSIEEDPDRISKIHNEASRCWGHQLTRLRISGIVVETLRRVGEARALSHVGSKN